METEREYGGEEIASFVLINLIKWNWVGGLNKNIAPGFNYTNN